MKRKVDEYFAECHSTEHIYNLKSGDIKRRKRFPNITGLANYLHVHRDTIYSYINGEEKTGNSEECNKQITDTLIYAKQAIADELLQAAIAGDADSRIAAMLLTAMGEASPEVNATVNVVIQGDSEAYSRYSIILYNNIYLYGGSRGEGFYTELTRVYDPDLYTSPLLHDLMHFIQ